MTGTSIFQQTTAGVVGQRSQPSFGDSVENWFLDSTYYPTAYGVPVKNLTGKAAALQSGNAATSIIGFLTNPTIDDQPATANLNAVLGTTVPNPARAHGVLRRGKIFVSCLGATAPAAEGVVYTRVRDNGSTSRAIGTIEAAQGTVQATAAAVVGTGNGVLTMASPSTGTGVRPGVYRVTFVKATTDLGNFHVTGPDGLIVGAGVVATPFTTEIKFTIADGSTDFIPGDYFLITAVADCEAIPGATFVGLRDSGNLVEVRYNP